MRAWPSASHAPGKDPGAVCRQHPQLGTGHGRTADSGHLPKCSRCCRVPSAKAMAAAAAGHGLLILLEQGTSYIFRHITMLMACEKAVDAAVMRRLHTVVAESIVERSKQKALKSSAFAGLITHFLAAEDTAQARET